MPSPSGEIHNLREVRMVDSADTPPAKKAREAVPADMRFTPRRAESVFRLLRIGREDRRPAGGRYWPRWVVSGRLGEGCTWGPYRVLSCGVSRTTSAGS